MSANADAPAYVWTPDPLYETQVHYERQTPCLLLCAPPIGPAVQVQPGAVFESFSRVRTGAGFHRARTARIDDASRLSRLGALGAGEPHTHACSQCQPEAVKTAVDQCADVGFEMVILTFGSGFDVENEKPEYLAQLKELVGYARNKGIVLGGYSLLASRAIDVENDVVNPKPRFGNSPCLGSRWGQDYFRKLSAIFRSYRLRRARTRWLLPG